MSVVENALKLIESAYDVVGLYTKAKDIAIFFIDERLKEIDKEFESNNYDNNIGVWNHLCARQRYWVEIKQEIKMNYENNTHK